MFLGFVRWHNSSVLDCSWSDFGFSSRNKLVRLKSVTTIGCCSNTCLESFISSWTMSWPWTTTPNRTTRYALQGKTLRVHAARRLRLTAVLWFSSPAAHVSVREQHEGANHHRERALRLGEGRKWCHAVDQRLHPTTAQHPAHRRHGGVRTEPFSYYISAVSLFLLRTNCQNHFTLIDSDLNVGIS